jgi:hypothetical protein
MKYVYICIAIVFLALGFLYLYTSEEIALTKECSICSLYRSSLQNSTIVVLEPKKPFVQGHLILVPKSHTNQIGSLTHDEKGVFLEHLNQIDWLYFKNYSVIGHRFFVNESSTGHFYIDVVPKTGLWDYLCVLFLKSFRSFVLPGDQIYADFDFKELESLKNH